MAAWGLKHRLGGKKIISICFDEVQFRLLQREKG
jgi:hypothetical protein